MIAKDSALPPGWLRTASACVTIQVAARPSASRRRIIRVESEALVISLTSPPERGKANDELREFIADLAKVRPGAVTIARGASARAKTVRIETADPSALAKHLLEAVSQAI